MRGVQFNAWMNPVYISMFYTSLRGQERLAVSIIFRESVPASCIFCYATALIVSAAGCTSPQRQIICVSFSSKGFQLEELSFYVVSNIMLHCRPTLRWVLVRVIPTRVNTSSGQVLQAMVMNVAVRHRNAGRLQHACQWQRHVSCMLLIKTQLAVAISSCMG